MKLHLRVHYGWLPEEINEGVPRLDHAIENALTSFGFQITLMTGVRFVKTNV